MGNFREVNQGGVDVRASQKNPGQLQIRLPNGQTLLIENQNVRDGILYDTVEINNGAMSEGKQYNLFRDITDKDAIDTNITTSRRLATGEKMKVLSVGVYIPNMNGNKVTSSLDFLRILENGFLEVKINKLLVAEGPLWAFPCGFGVAGSLGLEGAATAPAVATLAGVLSNGVPATKMQYFLRMPQDIYATHDIDAKITFFGRDWLSSAGYSSDEMPTIAGYPLVKVVLGGIIWGVN